MSKKRTKKRVIEDPALDDYEIRYYSNGKIKPKKERPNDKPE